MLFFDTALVAVSKTLQDVHVGEANVRNLRASPMPQIEREAMIARLFGGISQIMDKAQAQHQVNYQKLLTENNEVEPDFITRVSTNEFFFYTEEPLTIGEYTELQKKIKEKAKTLPAGIQLILGSFAVKTDNNMVMNVTPHISCGETPSSQNIVKSNTSDIDVHYSIAQTDNSRLDLNVLDAKNASFLPEQFTFNTIVECYSSAGTKFLSAVEICLDHHFGIAKTNLIDYLKNNPQHTDLVVSHVLISNSLDVEDENSIGFVMHVDPLCSIHGCKKTVPQVMKDAEQHYFGTDAIKIFQLEPSRCFTLSYLDARPLTANLLFQLENSPLKNKKFIEKQIVKYENTQTAEQRVNIQKEWMEQIDNATKAWGLLRQLSKFTFGQNDTVMKTYLRTKTAEFQNAATNEETKDCVKELGILVSKLNANPLLNDILSTIATLKEESSIINTKRSKSEGMEKVMKNFSIEDRATLTPSVLNSIKDNKDLKNFINTKPDDSNQFKQRLVKLFSKEKSPDNSLEKNEPKL